ncbi:MAG: Gfo/Idh/MocA family oxidoreductase [Chloroflexota bacterium]|nr:MAG: Gfo/Idh/MocA family oxidoreductase [Chloroflexota bacterium]
MTRIAIVGCGSIGRRHLANLHQLGYRDLLVFDPLDSVRDMARRDFGVTACDDMTEVWARDPDVSIIATPSNLHTPLAMAAASVGSHLFVEKPLAHTVDRLDSLQDLVVAKGLVTMVGCNMRFHPGPVQIKRWLDEGAIGGVIAARIKTGSYLPGWRPQQDYRQSYSASPEWGGAMLDCIHELDLAVWLLGEAELRAAVTRPATSLGLATDGLAELILEHATGALSNVHVNFVQRNYRRSIEIIGELGTLHWDFTTGRVDLYGADGSLTRSLEQPTDWQVNQMYVDELCYFMECVRTRTQTFNPIVSAARTLRVALEARNGR